MVVANAFLPNGRAVKRYIPDPGKESVQAKKSAPALAALEGFGPSWMAWEGLLPHRSPEEKAKVGDGLNTL